MFSKLKLVIFFLIIPVIFHSCEKPKKHPLPDVNVSIYLNINDAENAGLKVPGGSKLVDDGINGVIIYRLTENTFNAYEVTCPYQPENNCKVENNGAIATCPCCNSKYSLLDGSKFEGPSEWPLKSYYTNFDGTYLIVSN